MIKTIEVKTYMTKIYCDECGEEMIQENDVLMTYPPRYGYYCPKCNKIITANKSYPYMSYKEVGDE